MDEEVDNNTEDTDEYTEDVEVEIEEPIYDETKSFTKEDLDWISITVQALSDDNFIVERYFEALVQLNVNILGITQHSFFGTYLHQTVIIQTISTNRITTSLKLSIPISYRMLVAPMKTTN